jgi:hypothetical protein
MLKRVLPYFFMALLLTLFGAGVGYVLGKGEEMSSLVLKEQPVKKVVQKLVPKKVAPVVAAPPQPKEEKAVEAPQQVAAVVVPAEPKTESPEQNLPRKAKSRKVDRRASRGLE